MFGKMVDVALADQFVKRNAIGVLRLPFGREEKNNIGSNSLFVSGRDSKDRAITVYSEYLPKCIFAVRQMKELLTQNS